MRRKSWSELSGTERRRIVAAAVVQSLLQAIARRDLRRRRPEELNGPRWVWVCATSVTMVGPGAYLLFGRHRSPAKA